MVRMLYGSLAAAVMVRPTIDAIAAQAKCVLRMVFPSLSEMQMCAIARPCGRCPEKKVADHGPGNKGIEPLSGRLWGGQPRISRDRPMPGLAFEAILVAAWTR